MLRLTGCLCEFIDNDFRYGTTFSHSFAGDYNSVLLLRHCVSNRVNASSAMCKETIPDLLYNVIWNREIRPDIGSIIGQKGFLDFMRIATYMMLYCPQETVKRLTPCLETLFNWIAGLFSTGYIEMPGFHCQCIAMLCDLVTLMAKSDPAILQLLCDEGPMDAAEIREKYGSNPLDKGTILLVAARKHMLLMSEILNHQMMDPNIICCALRLWTLVFTIGGPRIRRMWMGDVIHGTPEKPGGILEMLLPYLGSKKYKNLYESCFRFIEYETTLSFDVDADANAARGITAAGKS